MQVNLCMHADRHIEIGGDGLKHSRQRERSVVHEQETQVVHMKLEYLSPRSTLWQIYLISMSETFHVT